ncbi:hypothetical protein LG3211_1816 [Lysobacter gummosus]|nr:hypothetical protein LG3211_1816 [Lysobacter gummosus]
MGGAVRVRRWVVGGFVIAANAGFLSCRRPLPAVIPANAGIQRLQALSHERHWIPAFAGMTS